MSPGKLAAQVAHAAVGAYVRYPVSDELRHAWWHSGHTKIVLEARDTEHLLMVERYLDERGVECVLIIDEGRTEIDPHTPTALGTTIVDKDDEGIKLAFLDLRTYKDRKPEQNDSLDYLRRLREAAKAARVRL